MRIADRATERAVDCQEVAAEATAVGKVAGSEAETAERAADLSKCRQAAEELVTNYRPVVGGCQIEAIG